MRTTIKVGVAALVLWVAPQDARACGGFFCNNQAIDQSGERILFSYNADGTVTTVVQIMYAGPSQEFAWILPIPAEPTVSVGTDELFRRLEGPTAPQFFLDYTTTGTCRDEPDCSDHWDDDYEYEPGGRADAGVAFADAGRDPDVEVSFRGNVGPYDVAVLRSGDGDALRLWLSDNGYLIPAEAGAELDHYVALDHYFVALKLQQNRGSGEIQPIVLRSENNEPCIPIRLTRIATVPNMPITAYFLAERRVRPLNYMLVEPDFDNAGLFMGGTSYSTLVSQTVDDAGGHAFVTDYAGDVPETGSIAVAPIEDMRTITDPSQFVIALQSRGFTGDAQLLALLMRFVPPPVEYDPQTFYNCIVGEWCDGATQAYLAALAFDPNAFVDALNEAIITPRRDAEDMLDAHEHLTRLYTTLSAEEMTEDPMFMRSEELPREYSNFHSATLRTECGPDYFYWTAPQTLILPSGREEPMREGVEYHGSDEEYCDDYYEGDFHPGTPITRLREVAASRPPFRAGGGALCSASHSGSGVVLFGLALAAIGLALRRRK